MAEDEYRGLNLFSVLFHVEGMQSPVGLRFKSEEVANEVAHRAWDSFASEHCVAVDDFGVTVRVRRSDVRAISVLSVSGDLEAQTIMQVLQQRAQARLQQTLESDPVLRFAASGGSGGFMHRAS